MAFAYALNSAASAEAQTSFEQPAWIAGKLLPLQSQPVQQSVFQPVNPLALHFVKTPLAERTTHLHTTSFGPAFEPNVEIATNVRQSLCPPSNYMPSVSRQLCYPQPYCPTSYCQPNCHPPAFCQSIVACRTEGYRVKLAPYGWLSEMRGNVAVAGVSNDVNIGTSDLLNILKLVDGAAFGRIEVDNNERGLLLDTYWIAVGLDRKVYGFDFSTDFEMAIVELAYSQKLHGLPQLLALPPQSTIELLAGGRYWMLNGAGSVRGPLGIGPIQFSGRHEWVDPIFGGRMTVPISHATTIQARADIGGFGWGRSSDFTWNTEAVIQRRWTERCSLVAGYRILDVNQNRGNNSQGLVWNMQFRGPIFQIALQF